MQSVHVHMQRAWRNSTLSHGGWSVVSRSLVGHAVEIVNLALDQQTLEVECSSSVRMLSDARVRVQVVLQLIEAIYDKCIPGQNRSNSGEGDELTLVLVHVLASPMHNVSSSFARSSDSSLPGKAGPHGLQ